jgi:nicotinamide-nucleotide amidase
MIYNQEMLNAVKDMLVAGEHSLAVAESVTSGHLQAAFSGAMDASKYFQGGITAYNLGQKARHLNVEPILADKVNSVEQRIANTMAVEVSKMFLSNYGIGITGYAALVAECAEEGLFAYFALSFEHEVVLSGKLTSPAKFPPDVQVDYTNQLIKHVHDYLKSKH